MKTITYSDSVRFCHFQIQTISDSDHFELGQFLSHHFRTLTISDSDIFSQILTMLSFFWQSHFLTSSYSDISWYWHSPPCVVMTLIRLYLRRYDQRSREYQSCCCACFSCWGPCCNIFLTFSFFVSHPIAEVAGGYGIWLGLNDFDSTGDFIWSDGTLLDYTNWDTPEYPDSIEDHHCVKTTSYSTHEWQNTVCDNANAYYMCKYIKWKQSSQIPKANFLDKSKFVSSACLARDPRVRA